VICDIYHTYLSCFTFRRFDILLDIKQTVFGFISSNTVAHSVNIPSLLPTAKVFQYIKLHATHSSVDPSLALVPDETTSPPTFTDKHEKRAHLKHRLALAFRIFTQSILAVGVIGYITIRGLVNLMRFLVNPFGVHFSLISDEDLIRVDHVGKMVDGG
jgi:hypothetical protein